jgi:hypothetical protein
VKSQSVYPLSFYYNDQESNSSMMVEHQISKMAFHSQSPLLFVAISRRREYKNKSQGGTRPFMLALPPVIIALPLMELYSNRSPLLQHIGSFEMKELNVSELSAKTLVIDFNMDEFECTPVSGILTAHMRMFAAKNNLEIQHSNDFLQQSLVLSMCLTEVWKMNHGLIVFDRILQTTIPLSFDHYLYGLTSLSKYSYYKKIEDAKASSTVVAEKGKEKKEKESARDFSVQHMSNGKTNFLSDFKTQLKTNVVAGTNIQLFSFTRKVGLPPLFTIKANVGHRNDAYEIHEVDYLPVLLNQQEQKTNGQSEGENRAEESNEKASSTGNETANSEKSNVTRCIARISRLLTADLLKEMIKSTYKWCRFDKVDFWTKALETASLNDRFEFFPTEILVPPQQKILGVSREAVFSESNLIFVKGAIRNYSTNQVEQVTLLLRHGCGESGDEIEASYLAFRDIVFLPNSTDSTMLWIGLSTDGNALKLCELQIVEDNQVKKGRIICGRALGLSSSTTRIWCDGKIARSFS